MNGIVKKWMLATLAGILITGCAAPASSADHSSATNTAVPFISDAAEVQPTIVKVENIETPILTNPPSSPQATQASAVTVTWETMPIIPEVSPEMLEVFKRGQENGRDTSRFSKVGDCQNITTYFLAMFDSGNYRLGETYAALQPTIDHFKGSWWRQSLSVKGGMNVAAVQSPMWANPEKCRPKETPLACELRVYNPAFAVISLEESWSGSIENYDRYLRDIVEYVLEQDIVPIIATRAETESQDRRINPTVAQIAIDYKVPLWNFGAAARNLPNNGIRPDGFHITEGRSYFDDAEMLKTGWTQRNLTALQAIDAVYRGVTGQP